MKSKKKNNVKYWFIGIVATVWLSGRLSRKVLKSIETWDANALLMKESEFRKSLADHIRLNYPKYHVLEEDGSERRKADISVSNFTNASYPFYKKIAIELKYKLSSNTELDRLVGQVIGYKEHNYYGVIVVSIDPASNYDDLLFKKTEIEGLEDFLTVVEKFTD